MRNPWVFTVLYELPKPREDKTDPSRRKVFSPGGNDIERTGNIFHARFMLVLFIDEASYLTFDRPFFWRF
ncbi:hypothetical protein GSUB_16830 (plasmid) [Geoalkalibacter subterraneus]|uniref:Uncharacterized protein n=1 Tax=Geoalkalibacter subterraneus TaxID=483547 RepID=A0A0B5FX40_9BACT|nr:hypothetical protein GSUB_16830 [Geoalkalibacter subterraneus]